MYKEDAMGDKAVDSCNYSMDLSAAVTPSPKILIEDTCTNCGVCVDVCIKKCFMWWSGHITPKVIVALDGERRCIYYGGCRICINMCDYNAITIV